ncbi:MAG TPA: lysophospholipid acyltransferase family protein [bacterium]|nr:lysophospholipid acyltransferase family protein [bacterium]
MMRGWLELVAACLLAFLEAVGSLPLAIVISLGSALGHRTALLRWQDRLISAWARRVVARLGCRVQVEGLEHMPTRGPVVIMSNHQSYFDIPICLGHLGRVMGFVAKRELMWIPLLGYWMRRIHCVGMNRANVAASGELLAELSQTIREQELCYLIFPEGTRTRDPRGKIGPFRRGSLWLAQAQEIPVVPLSLDGSRFLTRPAALAATPRGQRLVRVRLAPMRLPARDLSSLDRKRFMEDMRQTILSNHEAIRVNWLVSPPHS